jgi:hypothetical protein
MHFFGAFMRKIVSSLVFLFVGLASAYADSAQRLSTCLTESTSGKDRKDLVVWIFHAMSSHPDLSVYLRSGMESQVLQSNITTGNLYTRLMAENCAKEMRHVMQSMGPKGVEIAFSTLGEVAMFELMRNPSVSAKFGDLYKYMDLEKIQSATQ